MPSAIESSVGAAPPAEPDVLLDIRDLRTEFHTDEGLVRAVDGVSFTVPRGRTVALVGESGCGKSVTALSIMRLIPSPPGKIAAGQVLLHDYAKRTEGRWDQGTENVSGRAFVPSPLSPSVPQCRPLDLATLPEKRMQRLRGNRIAMIFQEPMTSLNPVFTVGDQIVEAIELHQGIRGKPAWSRAVEMLHKVGISAPERRAREYPHQLSGGMRQRVMIAMALSCNPALLIADEPTTALDVTIQAQILDLLHTLQRDTGMSILIITHDLGVVAQIADEVVVMYAGKVVERAEVHELFAHPLHPYTQALLRCMPRWKGVQGSRHGGQAGFGDQGAKDQGIEGSSEEGRAVPATSSVAPSLRRSVASPNSSVPSTLQPLNPSPPRLPVIPGAVPSPLNFPPGCRFHPRCQLTAERAATAERPTVQTLRADEPITVLKRCLEPTTEPGGDPPLRELRPHHSVACWEAEKVGATCT